MAKLGAFHSVATLDNALIFRSGINFCWVLILTEFMNCSKGLWMRHLGTWFSSGLGSAQLMLGIKGLVHPKQF